MKRALIAAVSLSLVALLAWLFWPAEEPSGGRATETSPAPAPGPVSGAPAPTHRPPEPPQALTSTTETRILFGHVQDTESAPIAGATVRAVRLGTGEALVTRTGDDGGYVLVGVPASIERLEISAGGFEPQSFDRPSFPSMRRVRWDVVLTQASGVHGLVQCAGQPVFGARVALMRDGDDRPLQKTRSDGDGRFALDLDANQERTDTLEVVAWHAQYGRGAARVDGPGQVIIELPGGGFVEGTVRDEQGRPITSFVASASSLAFGDAGPPAQSFDSESGAFQLGPLSPGKQRVWVAAQGYQPGRSRVVEIQSGVTVRGVSFVLARSAELSGRVTDAETKRPIEGAMVSPAEWSADALAEAVGAMTDADGRYVLHSLPGGRTTIQATARGYRPLMHGGIEGASKKPLQLDFALTPIRRGETARSELTGIGAQLSLGERGVVVVGLIAGGSATGVLNEGDVIVMVDDRPVGEIGFHHVVQAIRGEAGSEVVLWVQRGGQGDPERVTLERRRVEMPHD